MKRKLIAIYIAILSLLGYQVYRDPVLEVKTIPSVVVDVKDQEVNTTERPAIKIGEIVTNVDGENEMVEAGFNYAKRVFASDCFRDKVLDGTFTNTNGLSNSQIYEVFLGSVITVNVTMFYGTRIQNYIYKTKGYDIGDGVVYANRFFIDTPAEIGSLILHELGHQKNFHHSSASDYNSIPYSFNQFYEDCYLK